MNTDNMRDYYLMSYSGDRIQAILGLRETLGCDLSGAIDILAVTPEDWTAIYVAESIAIDLGGPHPDIAARVLEIYAGVDPKGGETSALVRLFLDTAPPSMLARAELFIRKPYAILQFLWALETKVEKLEGDSISGIAPLRTALERLQKETTDKNLRKPLEKILVALRGKETQ